MIKIIFLLFTYYRCILSFIQIYLNYSNLLKTSKT